MNFFQILNSILKFGYVRLLRKLNVEDDVHYIGGGTFLPPPLSQKEEDEHIKNLSDENSRQSFYLYLRKKYMA